GFYNGNIDGVFGWGTYWALRNFQYEFGMKVDGIAGQKLKQKLSDASEYDEKYVKSKINSGEKFTHYGGTKKENTSNQENNNNNNNKKEETETQAVNVPQGYSQNDIQLLANAVYGEARG